MTSNRKIYLPLLALCLWGVFQFGSSEVLAQSSTAAPRPGGGVVPQAPICVDRPIKIDLPQDLKVETVEGRSQVLLKWSVSEQESEYEEEKSDAFMSYLESDPFLGKSKYKLKNIFADYIYHELIDSDYSAVQNEFKDALDETIEDSPMLEERNIKNLFTDYYPYIFVDQLKNEPNLAKTFLVGLEKGLPADTLEPIVFLKAVTTQLRQAQEPVALKNTAKCMAKILEGVSVEQFKPMAESQIYGSKKADIQAILENLKTQGKIQNILDAIKNDRALIAQTKLALKAGIHPVMDVWANNVNVQNLVKFYESDPEMRKLAAVFFETPVGKNLNDCIKSSYGEALMEMTQAVYLRGIEAEHAYGKPFNDKEATVVLQALKEMLKTAGLEVETEVNRLTQRFINDYLLLEEEVNRVNSIGTPFGDYYQKELERYVDEVEGMVIEVQRDGKVIATLNNPNITQFVDHNVPVNNSGQVAYHHYTIVTRTPCESQTGSSAQAAINPVLSDGTPVKVFADIEIRLKNSQTVFFMNRLNTLLEALKEGKGKIDLSEVKKLSDPLACNASRDALLKAKTSDKLFPYVLNCFGDGQINEALQNQMEAIVNPLIRFLELNQFTDTDQVTEVFLAPIIELAREEYKVKMELLDKAKPLAAQAEKLLAVKQFDDFTSEQKHFIKCGGHVDCPENMQQLMEKYLSGGHAENLNVVLFSSRDETISSQMTRTDIFGEASHVPLGELKVGMEYKVKVKLANEPYALPKISHLRVSDAKLVGEGKFESSAELKTKSPFLYGNFDPSNDQIDLKDIEAWAKLVEEDPKKWSNYNIDGFTGVDLFDASLLQNNWGTSSNLEQRTEITLSELVKIFGKKGGDASLIYTPEWLLKLL